MPSFCKRRRADLEETIELPPMLFNSPLETGVRSAMILNAAYPRGFDLTQLTWLDHLVVHTGDFSGPASLHPDIPQRAGELIVRRTIVAEGLSLMCSLHMVESIFSPAGITYSAKEETSLFTNMIRTPYGIALKERAEWLIKFVSAQKDEKLASLINKRIGRWNIEFRPEESMDRQT